MQTTKLTVVLWRNLEHKGLWDTDNHFDRVSCGDAEYTLVDPLQLIDEMADKMGSLSILTTLKPLVDELIDIMNVGLLIGLDG